MSAIFEPFAAWSDGSGLYRLSLDEGRTRARLAAPGEEFTVFALEATDEPDGIDWADWTLTDSPSVAWAIDWAGPRQSHLRLEGVTYLASEQATGRYAGRLEFGPVTPAGGLFSEDIEEGDRIADPLSGEAVTVLAVALEGDAYALTVQPDDGGRAYTFGAEASEVWPLAADEEGDR